MSFESVRAWLAVHAPDLRLIEGHRRTATVAEAAAALGVGPERIAKTLAVRAGGETFLLVARGDARLSNGKCKAAFGARPRMLGAEETLALTGHPVGGVCPFGLATPLAVYLDVSLEAFETVYPAAGSLTSSVEVTPQRLFALVGSRRVDLCTLPEPRPPKPGAPNDGSPPAAGGRLLEGSTYAPARLSQSATGLASK